MNRDRTYNRPVNSGKLYQLSYHPIRLNPLRPHLPCALMAAGVLDTRAFASPQNLACPAKFCNTKSTGGLYVDLSPI